MYSKGIFRKNKRVSNSNGNAGANPMDSSGSGKQKHGSGGKGSQIILNSYKKSNTETIASSNNNLINDIDVSTSGKKSGTGNSMRINMTPIMPDHGQFNQCPKLDEVAMIEPLICKRIANERLTSLVFRHDCFVVATQDGVVYTWARPVKV